VRAGFMHTTLVVVSSSCMRAHGVPVYPRTLAASPFPGLTVATRYRFSSI